MTRITPHFEGRYSTECIGYKRYLFWRIPIVRYVLNLDFPLCFVRADGIRYRPELVLSSDGGSIPYTVQNIASMIPGLNLKRDQFPKSFGIHDSGYKNKGLWVLHPDCIWVFISLYRCTVDLILLECLQAEGANMAERTMIYAGVRAGGWAAWNKQRLF